MGMFDCYVPVPAISCPCGASLDGWQGKGGPCLMYTWTQGQPAPELSRLDQMYPAKDPGLLRLLDGETGMMTQCKACKSWIDADCVVRDGVWVETHVVSVSES